MCGSCQQGELYRAEETCDPGPAVDSGDLQAFVDSMRDTKLWVYEYEGLLRVEAYSLKRRGSVGGYYPELNAGKVEMDKDHHLFQLWICHEVAHAMAHYRYGSRSHDPWFADTYLRLVYEMMGPEAYLNLYTAFVDHGIDFRIDREPNKGVIAL